MIKNDDAVFHPQHLWSYIINSNWYIKYYHALTRDDGHKDLVSIMACSIGYGDGGAFWMCSVRPQDIKGVHELIVDAKTWEDLADIREMWHYRGEAEIRESLSTIPLIFEMRIPGSVCTPCFFNRTYTVSYTSGHKYEVPVSTDYCVEYKDKVYYASDFEPFVSCGQLCMRTRQDLVVSCLQRVLQKIWREELSES